MFAMAFQVFFGICNCFRCMLQVFQLFQTYAARVSSGCCKSRSGVTHVAMGPTCRSCWGAAEQVQTVPRACAWEAEGVASGPRVGSGGTGDVRACGAWEAEGTQVVPSWGRAVWSPRGRAKRSVGAGVRPDVRALATPFRFSCHVAVCSPLRFILCRYWLPI